MSIEELAFKVFNNPVLVENILSFDPKLNKHIFSYRLLNRTFNTACLQILKKDFAKLDVEVLNINNEIVFRVNNRMHVPYGSMGECLNFLANTVHTKITELRIKDIWKLDPSSAREFHDYLHSILIKDNQLRVLIGLEEACNGCPTCLYQSYFCEEYGPIGIYAMNQFRQPVHFQKLIVTDTMMDQLATNCVAIADSADGIFIFPEIVKTKKDILFEEVDRTVNPYIVCDNLEFWIQESIYERSKYNGRLIRSDVVMPRKVIEKMLQNWNPKSISIRLYHNAQKNIRELKWFSRQLNELMFTDHFSYVPHTDIGVKFRHLELDLSESHYCVRELRRTKFNNSIGYNNIIANLRRVFPTDEINVKGFYDHNLEIVPFRYRFENLSRLVFKELQPDLTINFQCFLQGDRRVDYLSYFNQHYTIGEISESHPEMIRNLERDRIHKRRTLQWVGKKTLIKKPSSNMYIYMDFFTHLSPRSRR